MTTTPESATDPRNGGTTPALPAFLERASEPRRTDPFVEPEQRRAA